MVIIPLHELLKNISELKNERDWFGTAGLLCDRFCHWVCLGLAKRIRIRRMNERIRELARQARYDSKNEKHYLERVHNREITLDEYQEIYDKKFAELIVRECEQVSLKNSHRNDDMGAIIAKQIKKHFGVEE